MRSIKWKHINRWFGISTNENLKFTLLNEFIVLKRTVSDIRVIALGILFRFHGLQHGLDITAAHYPERRSTDGSNLLNSSSLRMTNCKWRGTILLSHCRMQLVLLTWLQQLNVLLRQRNKPVLRLRRAQHIPLSWANGVLKSCMILRIKPEQKLVISSSIDFWQRKIPWRATVPDR